MEWAEVKVSIPLVVEIQMSNQIMDPTSEKEDFIEGMLFLSFEVSLYSDSITGLHTQKTYIYSCTSDPQFILLPAHAYTLSIWVFYLRMEIPF